MRRGESWPGDVREETRGATVGMISQRRNDEPTGHSLDTQPSTFALVPIPGAVHPDVRLLGRSNRERNARVAARVGATLVAVDALASLGSQPAVIVPSDVAVNPSLFDSLPRSPRWLESAPGAAVLAGPAAQLLAYLDPPTNPSLDPVAQAFRPAVAASALPREQIDPAACLYVGSVAARRRAEWIILRRTEKETDGWVSRNCNRPISRVISFALLRLGLTASHASFLTLMLGLATAIVAAEPGYVALVFTGVLFQLASIFDGVDGEMARATLTESEAGARLDTIVDQITYIACFGGVTIGWVRQAGELSALWWTLLVGAALVLSLARGGRFVAKHSHNASFVCIDRAVRRAARDTGRATLQLAAAAFTLLRRDVFAMIFFFVSLTGQRVLIPLLIAFGVVVANVTFSRHHRELAEAAAAERLSAT